MPQTEALLAAGDAKTRHSLCFPDLNTQRRRNSALTETRSYEEESEAETKEDEMEDENETKDENETEDEDGAEDEDETEDEDEAEDEDEFVTEPKEPVPRWEVLAESSCIYQACMQAATAVGDGQMGLQIFTTVLIA
jgi:hypothetical protein